MESSSSSSPPSSLLSPSHAPTSSEKLADIAARVVRELHLDCHSDKEDYPFVEMDDFYSSLHVGPTDGGKDGVTDCRDDVSDDDDDGEFEFCVLGGDHNATSPVSADDIFSNGQIKPLYYPVFDTSLLDRYDGVADPKKARETPLRVPLRKLMTEDANASCSSSDADDLDGVPHETYCVWVPRDGKNNNGNNSNGNIDDVATMKKKSKSTGSSNGSKRWRLRDILIHYNRSNSDGKDKFVFLTHGGTGAGAGGTHQKNPIPADKRKKTYLPYRQDLVGFFSTPTGLRNVRHF